MSIIRKSLLCLSLLLLALSPWPGKEDNRIENQPVAIEEATALPNQEILGRKENRFVYLDVSNEFIAAAVPLLKLEGQINAKPTTSRSIGAHIIVFDEKEGITPAELGNVFSFEVKEIRNFTLHTRDALKKLWVIAINSPELEYLQEKYGCSPRLKPLTASKSRFPCDFKNADAYLRDEAKLESLASRVN